MVPTVDEPGRFLTVAEVARMLRVSNMTVYRLISAGDYRFLERVWLKVPTAAYETYVAQYRRLRPGARYR